MTFFCRGVLWGALFLLVSRGLFADAVRLPVPPFIYGAAYDQNFYFLTVDALCGLSYTGQPRWHIRRDSSAKNVFFAFNAVYLWGTLGITQIDSQLGVMRWHRDVPGMTSLSHRYPYLIASTPTGAVYIHPDTGFVMGGGEFVPVSAMARPVEKGVLQDGKSCLTVAAGVLTLRGGAACDTVLFRTETTLTPQTLLAYVWASPTLSVLTPSEILIWANVKRQGMRVGRGERRVTSNSDAGS